LGFKRFIKYVELDTVYSAFFEEIKEYSKMGLPNIIILFNERDVLKMEVQSIDDFRKIQRHLRKECIQIDFVKNYSLPTFLGCGTYGDVFTVRYLSNSYEFVAKCIKKEDSSVGRKEIVRRDFYKK
jgi:hypothetical protein